MDRKKIKLKMIPRSFFFGIIFFSGFASTHSCSHFTNGRDEIQPSRNYYTQGTGLTFEKKKQIIRGAAEEIDPLGGLRIFHNIHSMILVSQGASTGGVDEGRRRGASSLCL